MMTGLEYWPTTPFHISGWNVCDNELLVTTKVAQNFFYKKLDLGNIRPAFICFHSIVEWVLVGANVEESTRDDENGNYGFYVKI